MIRHPFSLLAVGGSHPQAHPVYHGAIERLVQSGRIREFAKSPERVEFPWITAVEFTAEDLGFSSLDEVETYLASADDEVRWTNFVDHARGSVMQVPFIEEGAHVDARAEVTGGVFIRRGVFIAPEAVIRMDEKQTLEPLRIGEDTNLQDEVIVHASGAAIGSRCIVAHNAIVHGAVLEDECTVYIKALVDTGAYVEGGTFLDAGAYVGRNVRIPASRYVAPMTSVCTQQEADRLPMAGGEHLEMHAHVLAHNAQHAERYVQGQYEALCDVLGLDCPETSAERRSGTR